MDFGTYLQEALDAAGLSRRAFARLVRYHPSNIDQIIHGRRPPPLKHIDAWAKALEAHLSPQRFRELAQLAHCPEPIRQRYERMQASTPTRIRELEERLSQVERFARRIAAEHGVAYRP